MSFASSDEAIDHYLEQYERLAFGQRQIDIAYFRAGSFEYLKGLGFKPIIVGTPTTIFFYWVSDRIYRDHVAALDRLGFKEIAHRSLLYQVSPDVSEHFSSGEELLGQR